MEGKSEEEVRQEVEQRLREIELLREEAQQRGLSFHSLSEEKLARKIRGESSSSPYGFALAWVSDTIRGYPAYYEVNISNPDGIGYYPLFVTVFFGAANFLDDIGEGISGRDTQWPFLTSYPFGLAPGATVKKTFNYTTPTSVPTLTTSTGNSVLWLANYDDKGTYFDRNLFHITVA
jgi:hypothetical protein